IGVSNRLIQTLYIFACRLGPPSQSFVSSVTAPRKWFDFRPPSSVISQFVPLQPVPKRFIPLAIVVVLRCQLHRAGVGCTGGGEAVSSLFGLRDAIINVGGVGIDVGDSIQIKGGAVEVLFIEIKASQTRESVRRAWLKIQRFH